MSKELEALKKLCENNAINIYDNDDEKELKIIETALKDIDEIMSNHNCSNLSELNEKLCDYEELKFDDDIKQMKLNAFEIIKKKRLNADEIYHKDYEWYMLDHRNDDVSLIPIKEEFDLLKEMLS